MSYQDEPTEQEWWEQWTDEELIVELPKAEAEVYDGMRIAGRYTPGSAGHERAWYEVHSDMNWLRRVQEEMAQRELLILKVSR